MTSTTTTDPLLLGLRVADRCVLVVGGGPVALRRVARLLEAGADVRLVAPDVVPALRDLADRQRLTWHQRGYRPADLDEAWLVFACTNDPEVNAEVLQDATTRHLWCSRADDATTATAWTPAVGRSGPASVAVLSGRDPVRSARLRDAAVAAVEVELRAGRAESGRAHRGPRHGRVVLVGGGPGDPGLLTRRGYERLAEADVVLADRLAPLAALDGLHPDVEVVDVAKLPRGALTTQEAINALLVRHARAGRTVVRLKGGDPFVFGRGFEELTACADAGIDVEVVPGVTSAVSVPGLAGVPVTHRGVSQGFSVVSGHLPPGHPDSTVNWGALARTGTTIVCLMAVATLPAIATELVAHGLAQNTPVAVVEDGGLPTQRVLRSSLSQVAAMMSREQVTAPAVVVIGEVAALTQPAAPAPNARRVDGDVGHAAARHQPGAAPQGAHGRAAGALR
ncbi:uroporphyrinogen-III C-methyltransferase [Angustibacter sp. Root456]|uniref:uroporphyrinogen-III C-methyltransferase n=1 Tax=Angustibacter sp. Root456 TaxID=1736539 RepID=UPI0009E7EC10|nr:uroporphyrinogen-III C-methyltransferase [Angustibacter sp. Root456]